MAVFWPMELPFFRDQSAFTRTSPENAVLRTSMDRGPAKQRLLTSAAPEVVSGASEPLSPGQFAIFKDFFRYTLGQGALPFEVLDPLDNIYKRYRFMGRYSLSQVGGYWLVVTAQLEMLQELASAEEASAFDTGFSTGFFA